MSAAQDGGKSVDRIAQRPRPEVRIAGLQLDRPGAHIALRSEERPGRLGPAVLGPPLAGDLQLARERAQTGVRSHGSRQL